MSEELHNKAMLLADEAFFARQRKDWEAVEKYSMEAYRFEIQAANSFSRAVENEPTRSVLFRSAAALALEGRIMDEAERAVYEGLLGYPPPDVRLELMEILDQLSFERHLSVQGYKLSHEDFQLSLQGPSTGSGLIPTNVFASKVNTVEKIAIRTTERKLGKDFRKAGAAPNDVQKRCNLFLEATRPNCFAAIIKIAFEPEFEGLSFAEEVVQEIVECVDYFVDDNIEALQERIPNHDYLENFLALSSQLAPDGEELSFVGLTANIQGEEKRVKISKTSREYKLSQSGSLPQEDETVYEPSNFTGFLKYADSLNDNNIIKIRLDEGKNIKIFVPPSLMEDVVRPFYNSRVEIECVQKGKSYQLISIRAAN